MEKYDEIFVQVMEELDYQEWYDLFDGDDFYLVEYRCSQLEDFDQKDFDEWAGIMALEL